ncbi:hypothetical protein LCGC14_1522170, partial [marine sediment metagenome]
YKVYTRIKHVSRSGMMRAISAYVIIKNKPICLDWYIEKLTSFKRNKNHGGLTLSGCGMDMGFHLVYSFSSVLYPKGFRSSRRNRFNGMKPTDKGYNWDNDGGYRLDQTWM